MTRRPGCQPPILTTTRTCIEFPTTPRLLMLASANRDERHFEEPDRFNSGMTYGRYRRGSTIRAGGIDVADYDPRSRGGE